VFGFHLHPQFLKNFDPNFRNGFVSVHLQLGKRITLYFNADFSIFQVLKTASLSFYFN